MENFKILEYFSLPFNMSVLLEVNLGVAFDLWVPRSQSLLSLASFHIKGDKEKSEEPKCCPHFKGSSSSGSCYSLSRRVKQRCSWGWGGALSARYSDIQLASTLGRGTFRGPSSTAGNEDVAVYTDRRPLRLPPSQHTEGQSASSVSEWTISDGQSPAGGAPLCALSSPQL